MLKLFMYELDLFLGISLESFKRSFINFNVKAKKKKYALLKDFLHYTIPPIDLNKLYILMIVRKTLNIEGKIDDFEMIFAFKKNLVYHF